MFGLRKLKEDVENLKIEKHKLFKNDDEFIVSFGRLEVSLKTISNQLVEVKEQNELLKLECQIFRATIDDMMPLVFKEKKKPGPKPKVKPKPEKKDGKASKSQ